VGIWLNAVWHVFTDFSEEHNASISALDTLKKKAVPSLERGHAVAQVLRHCATSRKVASSISDGVIGFFSLT
jgi:hypothetical protein